MSAEFSLDMSATLSTVTAGEVMRPGVITCSRRTPLARIAAIMTAHAIHAVVVSPAQAGTALVVDDLDVIRAAVEPGEDVDAAELAREPIATVPADASLADAVAQMAILYVTHLLVTDPLSDDPAGVLSAFDVAAVVGSHDPRYARIPRPAPARPASSARELSAAAVADVMHPGVVTCAPDAPLSVVAGAFAAHRVHCVAVAGVDNSGNRDHQLTWALISDIDLIAGLHRDGATVAASTITAGPPVALETTESVARAAELMLDHNTRHLVAVGPTGLPAGILSTLDVAGIIAAND